MYSAYCRIILALDACNVQTLAQKAPHCPLRLDVNLISIFTCQLSGFLFSNRNRSIFSGMLGTAHIKQDGTTHGRATRLDSVRSRVRSGVRRELRPCDMPPRVDGALAREADLVDEGVGVAGEALGALVVEELAVVALRLRLGLRWCRDQGERVDLGTGVKSSLVWAVLGGGEAGMPAS